MNGFRRATTWPTLALLAVLGIAGGWPALAQHPGGGANRHLDGRFGHDRYYYDRGYRVGRLPPGAWPELRARDGGRYWYFGGNWYRRQGGAWVVWTAPIGVYVPLLPPYFTTVWWYGVPYYYANDTYYTWDDTQQQYEVVEPPQGIDSTGTPSAPPSDQLFAYPKDERSAEQQAQDRAECERWAAGQSGFDPAAAGVTPEQARQRRNDYFRAQVSCLEGRGYVVQ